jgi:hypothetical protein
MGKLWVCSRWDLFQWAADFGFFLRMPETDGTEDTISGENSSDANGGVAGGGQSPVPSICSRGRRCRVAEH